MTFRRGAVSSARFGPDGQVVYSASWDGGPHLVHVTRSDPRDFRTLEIQGMVVGASSSGEVAFLREGVLARAPIGRTARTSSSSSRTGPPAGPGHGRALGRRSRVEFPVTRPSRVRRPVIS
jgi:hypothetical protein